MTLQNILKEKKGTIVDVRSTEEFMGGNVAGSINIPLPEIPQRLEELKTLNQPLILCCASGKRSGQAFGIRPSKCIFFVKKGLFSFEAKR